MGNWRIVLVWLALTAPVALAQPAAEMRALLERGRAAEAYELGRRNLEQAGDPAFDLAFGIAAVNAGKPGEGVLALERYMLHEPGDEAARVALARGYFLLGDDARAREEFELALAGRPPAAVARAIEEHLDAIVQREARHRPSFTAHVEAGGGYDSNPRAGVDSPLISLPILGEVTVPENGVRVGDATWQYGAGLRATMPVASGTALFAAGEAQAAAYPDEDDFDQALIAGSAGLLGQWRGHSWRVGASRGHQRLDRRPYRDTLGAFAEWGAAAGERDVGTLGVQAGRFEYDGANAVRDSEFAAVAAGWRHGFATAWRLRLEAAASFARERSERDRHDLSRDIAGGRIGLGFAPAPGWWLGAGAAYHHSRYRAPDLLLETTREDRHAAADLALEWEPWRGLTVRAELTEARNDSNLALYQYRRRTAILRGRYEFR